MNLKMALIPVTLRDMFWTDPFFESAWGNDFDLLRRDMLHEHRRMWNRFGNEFLDHEQRQQCSNCCGAIESDSKKKNKSDKKEADGEKKPDKKGEGEEKMQTDGTMAERPWFMPPRRWTGANLGFDGDLAKPIDRANQLMRVKEDETKFEVSLDTHEFRPDELKVDVKDNNVLTVEGKHEEKSEDGTSFTSKHFFRRYALPKGCEAETIDTNLSSDGVLMITAPKNPALALRERAAPIQMLEHN